MKRTCIRSQEEKERVLRACRASSIGKPGCEDGEVSMRLFVFLHCNSRRAQVTVACLLLPLHITWLNLIKE